MKGFVFSANYKSDFRNFVSGLYNSEITDPKEKSFTTNDLIESYVNFTGERPEPSQLERLTNWILKGENIDGEFKSGRQLRRIYQEREFAYAEIEYDDRHMSVDGNRVVKAKPAMDSDESHKEWIRTTNDDNDKREFNGPLTKYFEEFM